MQISKLHHCVYALNYHLVLVTKYRRKCLTAPMLAEFEVQAKERCAAWGGRLIEANGEPDHVHLLIELPPTAALAEFVNALKTGTSRRLRTIFAQELAGVYSKPVLWHLPLQPIGAALPPGRKRPTQMDGAPRAIRVDICAREILPPLFV